jgi:hypothetical protein
MTIYYVLLAVSWIVVSVLLGIYINGKWLGAKMHYVTGLRTIFIMYLLGICFLFVAITLS